MTTNTFVQHSLFALAGSTVLAILSAGSAPASAATVSLSVPGCTSFTLTPSGNGNFALNCTTGDTQPGAPTNCSVSYSTTPNPMTSSGGSANLSASCTGTTANTTWSWTRNGSAIGSNTANATDTLPGNGSSAAAAYSYLATVCNGSACGYGSASISVPGSSVAPPPGGTISCSGYDRTIVIDVPWVGTTAATRIQTSAKGGFARNDAVVFRFNVPSGVRSFSPGSIRLAEWGGGPLQRFATLSDTACDFAKNGWLVDAFPGASISVGLNVGGSPAPYTTVVQPGRVYYLNIRNTDMQGNKTCPPGDQCNMFLEFAKPPGT